MVLLCLALWLWESGFHPWSSLPSPLLRRGLFHLTSSSCNHSEHLTQQAVLPFLFILEMPYRYCMSLQPMGALKEETSNQEDWSKDGSYEERLTYHYLQADYRKEKVFGALIPFHPFHSQSPQSIRVRPFHSGRQCMCLMFKHLGSCGFPHLSLGFTFLWFFNSAPTVPLGGPWVWMWGTFLDYGVVSKKSEHSNICITGNLPKM